MGRNFLKESAPFFAMSGAVLLAAGCDFGAIKKCHDEMGVSQQLMVEFSNGDREDLAEAEKTLSAVERTLAACKEAKRTEEVEKITDAERKLVAHVASLKERAEREKRPKLTPAELADLKAKGDRSCPKGQEYEHYQNGEVIKCTGPQLVEMTPVDVTVYFKRRGFRKTEQGSLLCFERGAQVLEFAYASVKEGATPECVTIIADPGIPWQETVTRATGVNPLRLKLGKPVTTPKGLRDLLVEGGPEQFTVKLGKCSPTPGQKALLEEPARE
jgi:hypothetical protein